MKWYILPILIALSFVYLPHFWVYLCMVIDYCTDWGLFKSAIYDKYHAFLISRLQDREELPLPEITADMVSKENIKIHTKEFTFPLVIRGFLGNTTAVKEWSDPEWWMERYPDDEV